MGNAISFNSEIQFLKGVGPGLAKLLTRLDINTVADLILHPPSQIIDRSYSPKLSEAENGRTATFECKVISIESIPARRGKPLKILTEVKNGGYLYIIFFNYRLEAVKNQLPKGATKIISGKLERNGDQWQIIHPDVIADINKAAQILRPQPIYPQTEGLSSAKIRQLIQNALELLGFPEEWIESEFLTKQQWQSFKDAVHQLHNPQSEEDLEPITKCRQRLGFDEMLANQLALQLVRHNHKKQAANKYSNPERVNIIRSTLPFELTSAQSNALNDILEDMKSGSKMTRLIQGDVGSGKSAVGLLAAVNAAASGAQTALMYPTSILCNQQFEWAKQVLSPHGIQCQIITGADKPKERQLKLSQIKNGEVSLIFGTHALLYEPVEFHNLGLAVVDEQHRFGVKQRLKLSEKSTEGISCHLLYMTATPIPRTMTMAIYGDLDVSIINEKPPGRKPVDTRLLSISRIEEVVEAMQRLIQNNAQAYWICPLVEESEELNLSAVTERFKELSAVFGNSIGMVHGKMKPQEKDAVLQSFADGKILILLATTVIEVGVNVPNATCMIIEHAEKFGLSQLHQLRGRVGRGEKQSSCLLLYSEKTSKTSFERLKVMRSTDDGFKIAEADLQIRGGGEILGTKQSGIANLKFASLTSDPQLWSAARAMAQNEARRYHQGGRISPAFIQLLQIMNLYDSLKLIRS